MNERLIVVLLLITIVLSITSIAIIFSVPGIDLKNYMRPVIVPQSQQQASVSLVIEEPLAGGVG